MSAKRKSRQDGSEALMDAAKKLPKGVISRADAYLEGNYDPKAAARKAVFKGGTTALLVLSLLTGVAFSSPADINDDQAAAQLNQPPIVMDIDDYANAEVDDDDEADEEKGARPGVIARFRQAVLSLPSAVRLLIITPLWALGTALLTLISFLWNTIFASPIGAFIASLAMGFAVLLGLFTVTAKMLFPDVPLKKILSKRNIIILAVTALVLAVTDAAAPLVWHKYPAISALIKLAAGAGVVGVLSLRTKMLFDRITGGPKDPAYA